MRFLLLFLFVPLGLFSQNTIGLPDIINYSKQIYGGGLQNWDFKQDKNGILYVANNEGLLSFDGKNWNLFPLPNKTIVRSVEIGWDQKIYVGGQDEFGYFIPAENGQLKYHSLTHLIPAKDKFFGDVWDIVSIKKNIFFRSQNRIFNLFNNEIVVFTAPFEWSYLGESNGLLYAFDFKAGPMILENDVLKPLFQTPQLPLNDPVTSVIPINKDSNLVITLMNGIFILTKNGISKLQSINNQLFENERIYAATKINNERIALATSNNGVYIINFNGTITQSFSKSQGLQNNGVLSVFLDNQNNLWLGLDNGIDFIAYNSAIKHIYPSSQDGSGYTAIIHDNRFYAGTSNGLFSVVLEQINDLSFSKGIFSPVANAKGQTWGLASINNQLLVGKHEGAFVIKNNQAFSLFPGTGFWNFLSVSNTYPSAQILGGSYKGLAFFDFANNEFKLATFISSFDESSRYVVVDKEDNIWVSQPYHGVYKLSKTNNGSYTFAIYPEKKGLPTLLNNYIFKIKNEILVATEKGIMLYNQTKDSFEFSAFYKKMLGNQSIRYLKEDKAGNVWFIHEKKLGIIDVSGKEPSVLYLPELNNKLLSGFEFVYPVDEKNIFVGGEKWFFHINYEKYKQTIPTLKVQVRGVRIINTTDSVLFGGYFKDVNEQQIQETVKIPQISYNWKTLRFEFSSSLYGYQANLEYSYRLIGFDKNWSEWTNRTEKEYTTLPAGSYTFEVKVRNNLGNESKSSVYSFEILPPWHLSTLAYIFYFILFGTVIYFVYKWQRNKYIQQLQQYEAEQQKLVYIHELEKNKSESELVTLRNEKLEAEINFKNSEMASSAMHLVKKGELLTKIKNELTHVMKGLENPTTLSELKKVIKSLSEDDNMDKEWEHFSKHFDKVHSDFVMRLKEVHSNLTGNELKLCTYLRMNLSTKEIAQLMNISVRGVEISRYRLRKKLGLGSEVSLFDYLLKLTTKV